MKKILKMILIPLLWISAPKTLSPATSPLYSNLRTLNPIALNLNTEGYLASIYTVIAKKPKISPKAKNSSLKDEIKKNSEKDKSDIKPETKERGQLSESMERYSWYVTKKNSRDISPLLEIALETYKGPKVLITSGKRSWPQGSEHRHGRALDLDYDKDVTEYLMSDEGIEWLKENKLEWYIESAVRRYKDELNEREKDHYRHIPWATGHLHIHINLVREK
jgi:hypothetical protein